MRLNKRLTGGTLALLVGAALSSVLATDGTCALQTCTEGEPRVIVRCYVVQPILAPRTGSFFEPKLFSFLDSFYQHWRTGSFFEPNLFSFLDSFCQRSMGISIGLNSPIAEQVQWILSATCSHPLHFLMIKFYQEYFWAPVDVMIVTVLSRGVRWLFGPTRKSSPWGNFSDGRSFVVGSSDWLIDDKSTLTWLVCLSRAARSVFTGAGLKWPNTAGQYSIFLSTTEQEIESYAAKQWLLDREVWRHTT